MAMGMTCAFSGHRPEKLPWGTNEQDPRCQALKIQMEHQLRQLCDSGVDRFLCGMARGTDLMFAELVIKLRKEYAVTLEGVLPCLNQEKRWPQEEQNRFWQLLRSCDRRICLQKTYTEGCMLRRNRYMVDQAQYLLTVWDGNPHSGTGSTRLYAQQKGISVLSLWR